MQSGGEVVFAQVVTLPEIRLAVLNAGKFAEFPFGVAVIFRVVINQVGAIRRPDATFDFLIFPDEAGLLLFLDVIAVKGLSVAFGL